MTKALRLDQKLGNFKKDKVYEIRVKSVYISGKPACLTITDEDGDDFPLSRDGGKTVYQGFTLIEE